MSHPSTSRRREKLPRASGEESYATDGCDVGERPTLPTAHLEYPVYRPGTTEGQFEPGTIGSPRQFEANAKRKIAAKQSLEARLAERGSSGWASAQGEYKPLGAIAELPDTGNELRYKTKVRDAHRKPRVVVPLEDGKAAPVEDVLSKTKVLPGKTVRGEVPQFEYKYYEVELRRRCELVVSVDTLSGDPDIFVSNRTGHYPTQFDYTWKSASTGDDEVVVKTDHPAYCLGRYTIGVYGVYPSEFELLVVLQEPPLRLNLGELDEFSSNGYPLLSKLVGEAEERRRRLMRGRGRVPSPPLERPTRGATLRSVSAIDKRLLRASAWASRNRQDRTLAAVNRSCEANFCGAVAISTSHNPTSPCRLPPTYRHRTLPIQSSSRSSSSTAAAFRRSLGFSFLAGFFLRL